jgi:hypothetical protein
MEFYQSVGVSRTVGSRPDSNHYALRSLLSTRWLFDYTPATDDVQLYQKNGDFVESDVAAMPGWSYYGSQDGYAIYQNDYYVPMGFTYDYYITRANFDQLMESERELVMLKAIVVEDEQTVAGLPLQELDPYTQFFTQWEYLQNCADRATTAADSFEIDATGFTAVITPAEDDLVFFSAPYEDGWTATVNGKPADIRRVNVGFMAVACKGGETATIRFTYRTPGLHLGIQISLAALSLLLIYWLIAGISNRRRRRQTATTEQPAAPQPPLPPSARAAESTPPPTELLTPFDLEPEVTDFDLYSIYRPTSPENNKKE